MLFVAFGLLAWSSLRSTPAPTRDAAKRPHHFRDVLPNRLPRPCVRRAPSTAFSGPLRRPPPPPSPPPANRAMRLSGAPIALPTRCFARRLPGRAHPLLFRCGRTHTVASSCGLLVSSRIPRATHACPLPPSVLSLSLLHSRMHACLAGELGGIACVFPEGIRATQWYTCASMPPSTRVRANIGASGEAGDPPSPPTRLHAGMVGRASSGLPGVTTCFVCRAHTNEDAERGQAAAAAEEEEEDDDNDNGQGERRTASRDEPQARRGRTWCNE